MSTGTGVLALAREHVGEDYENVQVPKNNPNWHGPWDCAELVSWAVFQDAGILYGCVDDDANPATADAYTGAWKTDVQQRGRRVSVAEAAGTPGGILLRFPPSPGMMGHIVICDGTGGTVEARGHESGVVVGSVHGRRWDTGVLIPGIYYESAAGPIEVDPPQRVYFVGGSNMDRNVVRAIQQRLSDVGFDPGPIDGLYGAKTAAAVAAYQMTKGLLPDGEVGAETAASLGVTL